MEIKDYLHLYIGCDVQTPDGIEQLIAVGRLGSEAQRFRTCSSLMSYTHDWHPSNKPLLRKLSDMTEEEEAEMVQTQDDVNLDGYPQIRLKVDSGETFRWLV